MNETNSKTDKALAARTLYWSMVGEPPTNGTDPSPESLRAWEAVVGMLTDPDSYDATETVTITPVGIRVGGVEVPGVIDADSVYVKSYGDGADIFGVTLTIMAGAVELHDGVRKSPFVSVDSTVLGNKVTPRKPN